MISVFANGVSRHSVVAFFGLRLHRPGKAGGHRRTGELVGDGDDQLPDDPVRGGAIAVIPQREAISHAL
jgi:hypothetical protein